MRKSPHVIVAKCLEFIYPRRSEFSARFYDNMFVALPQAKKLFVSDRSQQEKLLFHAIANIERSMMNGKSPDRDLIEFGRMHAHAGVKREYFAVFGEIFLSTMIEFLPNKNRKILVAAWWSSYNEIAEIMIAGMELEKTKKRFEHNVFRKSC
ncbi:hypothetical protein GQE99_14420 [Maritimibacter sp. DP07]|uniref:Globin domain-containing protein n=1 Tax=Maritimibacter harenae TaxID=2606218 RepID=A0A845MAF1_9RHOB|nr:globin domain-containing protein [Maritimibacter harenae]MZR14214.1 hypothetical protein [Maritimibacter harenae]